MKLYNASFMIGYITSLRGKLRSNQCLSTSLVLRPTGFKFYSYAIGGQPGLKGYHYTVMACLQE